MKFSLNTQAGETDKIIKQLKELLFSDFAPTDFMPPMGDTTFLVVTGKSGIEKQLPFWEYPINFVSEEKKYMAVNLTQFADNGTVKSSYHTEYELLRLKLLAAMSENELSQTYKNIASSFAVWISQALAQAFSLSLDETATIEAVCYFWYRSLLSPDKDSDTIKDYTKKHMRKYKITTMEDTIKSIDIKDGTVSSFVDLLANTGAPALHMLTVKGLEMIISRTIIHRHSVEEAGIIFINPPSFTAMVFVTMSSSLYKRTQLFKVLKGTGNYTGLKDLLKAVEKVNK